MKRVSFVAEEIMGILFFDNCIIGHVIFINMLLDFDIFCYILCAKNAFLNINHSLTQSSQHNIE